MFTSPIWRFCPASRSQNAKRVAIHSQSYHVSAVGYITKGREDGGRIRAAVAFQILASQMCFGFVKHC